jgi:hypothetical protein
MKQFEYCSSDVDAKHAMQEPGLNKLGSLGWELVSFTSDGKYIFKREIPQSPEHTQNGYDVYGR